jgi:hypothetical protein
MSPTRNGHGNPSASFGLTMRLHIAADDPTAIGRVTTAVGSVDGVVAALDMVDTAGTQLTVDLTVNAGDPLRAVK